MLRAAPEVSILPPVPSTDLAFKVPSTLVTEFLSLMSDQITILPPSPVLVELASIRVFFSTVV